MKFNHFLSRITRARADVLVVCAMRTDAVLSKSTTPKPQRSSEEEK